MLIKDKQPEVCGGRGVSFLETSLLFLEGVIQWAG